MADVIADFVYIDNIISIQDSIQKAGDEMPLHPAFEIGEGSEMRMPTWNADATAPFGYAKSIDAIRKSTAHLPAPCADLDIPLEAAA
ncbi:MULTISPECIES: hypothetical protein [unclassified Rhizobium]|uniref:hypothetical protein n=1 Tax=unclassified Rhizobium TaxID=2613769 RepID=UPI00138F0885|nr:MULTISPECIES: hypothetical protein [unclassified Rhizobium]